MNGNIYKVVSGVIATMIVAGLLWASNTTMENKTDIAVIKSQFLDLKCNISEIKDTVKEIRDDQIRKAYKEGKN